MSSSKFAWNENKQFEIKGIVDVQGVQVAGSYFPLDEEYVNDEYMQKRDIAMKASTYKEFSADLFCTVFGDAPETSDISTTNREITTNFIEVNFKQTIPCSRVYSFERLYIPFIANIDTFQATIKSLEMRIDVTNDNGYTTFSKRLTYDSSRDDNTLLVSTKLFDETISEQTYHMFALGLYLPNNERFVISDNTKTVIRFSLEVDTSETVILRTCWNLMTDTVHPTFATDIANYCEMHGYNLQYQQFEV